MGAGVERERVCVYERDIYWDGDDGARAPIIEI